MTSTTEGGVEEHIWPPNIIVREGWAWDVSHPSTFCENLKVLIFLNKRHFLKTISTFIMKEKFAFAN